MSTRVILERAIGLVAGLSLSFFLFGFAIGTFHGINPQSLSGVLNTLESASVAIVAGAVTAIVPRHFGRMTRNTTLVLSGGSGLLVLVRAVVDWSAEGTYPAFVEAFVITPGLILGWVASERLRSARAAASAAPALRSASSNRPATE